MNKTPTIPTLEHALAEFDRRSAAFTARDVAGFMKHATAEECAAIARMYGSGRLVVAALPDVCQALRSGLENHPRASGTRARQKLLALWEPVLPLELCLNLGDAMITRRSVLAFR